MARIQRHIVAMGGGGFSMEPRNMRLDDYVLRLARKRKPRVCFLPTASGDSDDYIRRFYKAFPPSRAIASHCPLFTLDGREKTLAQHDVIYVGGGNTANALAVWRVHGIDRILRSAWKRGVVLCGVSAGMICWFESSVTDSFGPLAPLHDGLGILPGSACPHFDGEPQRRPTFLRLVRAGELPSGLAADDGAALHFVGTKLITVVTSRPKAKAHRIERAAGGKAVARVLPSRYL